MPRKIELGLLITGLLVYIITGCENKECISFSSNRVMIQFADTAGVPVDTTFSFVKAYEADLTLYQDTAFSAISVPVIPGTDQTTFIFGYPNETTDTLAVGYEIREQLISKKCGFELQYQKLEILRSTFPQALVVNEDLNILNENNIEITY